MRSVNKGIFMLKKDSFINYVFCLLALSSMALFSGCATIVSGKVQEVSFQSNPEGATVTVGGKIIGKTPITVQLDRKKTPPLMFELQGYQKISTQMGTTIEPWFLGNFIIGGLIGSTTDGLSGAIHEYSPNHYYVTMVPENSGVFSTNTPERTKIKEYVIIAYKNILSDLSAGNGEYLSSLINMLKVQDGENDTIIQKIKSLSEVYPDIPLFAERVSELYKT